MDTVKEYDIEIIYERNWNNDINTYNDLILLFEKLYTCRNKYVLIKMKKVEFVAANLLALLGCILDITISQNHHKVSFSDIHPNVKKLMQMNGFRKYFKWDSVDDKYHSTSEYKVFKATTKNLEEFEKYILINVLNRKEMPAMTNDVKDRIIDNFLEMFNNVIDHANSNNVYICGQYFFKSGNLVLTIVDYGKTIKENVLDFLNKEELVDEKCIGWAIVSGNSTKVQTAPGGLGFGMILEFLRLNQGCFTLISDNECYELNKKGERFIDMKTKFPGVIVTITFNLHDDFAYICIDDEIENIIF